MADYLYPYAPASSTTASNGPIDLLDDTPIPSAAPSMPAQQTSQPHGFGQQPPPYGQQQQPPPSSNLYGSSNNYSTNNSNNEDPWVCPNCSTLNNGVAPVCSACGTLNPKVVQEAQAMTAPPSSASQDLVPSYGPPGYSNYQLPSNQNAMATTTPASDRAMTSTFRSGQNDYDYLASGGRAPRVSNNHMDMVPYDSNNHGNYVPNSGMPGDLVPRYEDGTGAETHWEKKQRRRGRRRGRMALGAAGGFVVGAALGPVGAVGGAVAGATIARQMSKDGERKKDERVATAQLQQQQRALMSQYQQHQQYGSGPSR